MVTMRLADDTRGRVPFALLGVLLLVSSATFSGALSGQSLVTDQRVDVSMDRATAQVDATVRSAVSAAARDAAANPVTTPANTTVGRVLSENDTFRDYLKLRIALEAKSRLESVSAGRNGVRATASLPNATNESTLRTLLSRVSIESRENGTLLVATVENVSVEAVREGDVVASEPVTSTVSVQTPVLALHEKTETFERRLDANALNGGTLDATVTTALWTSAWARGWGQYSGLPIDNVVSNEHAALATNAGVLLAEQQTFGTTDRDARGAMGRAAARAGARAILSESGVPVAPEMANALPSPNRADSPDPTIPEDRRINVSAGSAADAAFVSLLDGTNGPSIADLSTDAYRADVVVVADVTEVADTTGTTQSPGDEWEHVETRTETDSSVTTRSTTLPGGVDDSLVVDAGSRLVSETTTTTRTWRDGNVTLTTRQRSNTTHRVDIAVVAEPHALPGPSKQIDPVFESGGVLESENLREAKAEGDDIVATRGGMDGLARDAVESDIDIQRTVSADKPTDIEPWIRADLYALHQRVKNRSVSVPARKIAAGEVNPAGELAASIRADRAELVAAPDTYDGVADRARVAARAAYLDRVLSALDRRANTTERVTNATESTAQDAGVESLSAAVQGARDARTSLESASENRTAESETEVRYVPDADPMYLSLSGLNGSTMPEVSSDGTYHPLAARNTNLFTLPYGDATDTVLSPIFGSNRRVPLRVAARALLAADSTLAQTGPNETLQTRRDDLEIAVTRSMAPTRDAARETLKSHTDLTLTERRNALTGGLSRWPDPAHRALAISNGSAARAIAVEVAGAGTTEADILELRLDNAFRDARQTPAATVPQRLTNRTVQTTRTTRQDVLADAVTDAAMNATEDAVHGKLNETLEKRLGKSFKRVPAGMPVAPVPGYWYATVNVWDVEVKGEFAQFRVHARGETESLTYARDGSAVELDWDDDGEAERVGRGERIDFETRVPIVVAVPPSGVGVGDIDGDADERSEGWANGPGCEIPSDCRVA
ncbi:hypothetical protein ACFQJC_12650 [Haloferax namakaokahaiae]|uniref:Secreted glycoprotein n=1 Tax=Haloferax namakaokahaiae TaxID=1748331 RepID=A0ABD5ZGD5_9EURY